MNTIENYLANLKVGNYVTDKRTLAAMKKCGFINDYTKWGEILPYGVYRMNREGFVSQILEYFGSAPKVGEKGSKELPLMGSERHEICMVFKGCRFNVAYDFGGMKAHLQFLGKAMEKSEMMNKAICCTA